jgi:enoyl-CoA hydratase
MDQLVSYQLSDTGAVAIITLDDGKANALSPAMQSEINAALDLAAADEAAVLLRGRDGVWCGGFDLKILTGRGEGDAVGMLNGGYALAYRLMSFPRPVVVECTGHAVAMGFFLLLSADYRIGPQAPIKLVANEVAIGLTMPKTAVEIMRQRLTPSYLIRATLLAEPFSIDEVVQGGLLDKVVPPELLHETALAAAEGFAALDAAAHLGSKLRAREETLVAMRAAMDIDAAEMSGRFDG